MFAKAAWRRGSNMCAEGRKGFTLLEVIIVVMITAILLSIAEPRISKTLTSVRLKTTATVFAGDLRRARVEALRRNVPITVRSQSGGSYQIDSIGQRTLEGDVTFATSSADSVRYATFGPSLTGGVTFVLSIGGDSVSVSVSPAGLATISSDQ